MQQWECIVCGWVYDEKIGDPDSGIAPGTKFEDIPDDWMCPECGVGKDDFELLEVPEAAVAPNIQSIPAAPAVEAVVKKISSSSQAPIVILGSGLAGYGLLKEIRKLDNQTPIVLITQDDGRAYSKPALSTGYTKGTTASDLAQLDAGSMAAQYGASIWTMTEVTSIETDQQRVSVNNGAAYCDYSKLVLALGSHCITPPISGNAADRILTVNDLMDFAQFQQQVSLTGAKKVCIIGAGLIGCEYANDLINGGFEVISIDPMSSCLPSLLPMEAGNAVRKALEDKGAEFHFGRTATQVDLGGNGYEITLDNGSTLQADIVLSAIGVRANTKLASEAGITVNRGITTDTILETSYPDVFALGDCAEVSGHHLVYIAPLMASVKALAKTLCGEQTSVKYPAMPVAVKTPACPVVVCPPPIGASGQWNVSSNDGYSVLAEFLNDDEQLAGFALTGDAISERSRLTSMLPNLID